MSLGRAVPNSPNGKCFSWWGINIEEGYAEEKWSGFNPIKRESKGIMDLSGLNVAILLEVPGPLGSGGWTAGLYIDEKASDDAADALAVIFSGQAGGQTGWFRHMIANFLGVKRCSISYKETDDGCSFTIPEIFVCKGSKRSRIRDHGRNWDFTGGSAEYCAVDWAGP